MIFNRYHINMPASIKPANSPKPTLFTTHPRFTSTLTNILLTEFKTVRRFAKLAGMHPTYFYTYLRDGKGGVVPRFDAATNLMRTVKEHAPHRFKALWESLRADVEADLESDRLDAVDPFKTKEMTQGWLKNGAVLPRPSLAKRFQGTKSSK